MGKTIEDVLALLGPHILADLNAAHDYNDLLESDMTKELENGRLVRLLTKFGFINERPECVSVARRRPPDNKLINLCPAGSTTTLVGPSPAIATSSSSSATWSSIRSTRPISPCLTSATS